MIIFFHWILIIIMTWWIFGAFEHDSEERECTHTPDLYALTVHDLFAHSTNLFLFCCCCFQIACKLNEFKILSIQFIYEHRKIHGKTTNFIANSKMSTECSDLFDHTTQSIPKIILFSFILNSKITQFYTQYNDNSTNITEPQCSSRWKIITPFYSSLS